MALIIILLNFTVLPVILLYSLFDYFYFDQYILKYCNDGFTFKNGSCLKNCPSYAVEFDGNCILFSNFYFNWRTSELFCNELDGELWLPKNYEDLNKVLLKLKTMISTHYPTVHSLDQYTLYIGATKIKSKLVHDELKRRKRELPKKLGHSRNGDEYNVKCPAAKYNSESKSWNNIEYACKLARRSRLQATVGFICSFPTLTFQEVPNDGGCGLPLLDPVYEPSHIWPQHIDSSSKSRQKRVVHGHPTNFSYWPWYGALKGCGSTLVHPNFVITAAHCKKVPEVHFGVDKQHSDWREHKFTLIADQTAIPTFRTFVPGCQTDLKLVKLNETVKIEPGISQSVCLPKYGTVYNDLTHFCFMAGYGQTKNTAMFGTSKHLQQIQLHPVQTYGPMQHFHPANQSLRRLPTKGGGALGDSGGPTICRLRGSPKWELVGPFCGGKGSDGYAAHMSKWRPWLDKVMFDMINNGP